MVVKTKAGRGMRGEETALVQAARAGDDEAFGRLIRPCVDPSFRLALRMLGDEREAEDAVQEALYKAWRSLPRFRGEAKFTTWLYRIVHRECVDRSRQRRRDPVPIASVPETGVTGGAEGDGARGRGAGGSGDAYIDPAVQVLRSEQRQIVEDALLRLSEPYRVVLTLFYIEDWSLKDIADVLQWPLGTVKTRLHRARYALRRALSGTDIEGERVFDG